MNKKIWDLPVYYLGILATLFYELPFLLLGQNAHLYIPDNLDNLTGGFLVMVREGKVFDFHSLLYPIMNGIPREFIANGINFSVLPYLALEPFSAYMVNDILVHFIAYCGMHLLLKNYLIKDETAQAKLVVVLASFAFALIPYFSNYGLSLAGQPLLFFAFLRLQEGKSYLASYLIIGLFPFYSVLVFAGAFIIPAIGFYILFLSVKNKAIPKHLSLGLLLLISSYIVAEYQLINLILFNKELISHRFDWDPYFATTSLTGAIQEAIKTFIAGHFHAKSHHTIILITAIITLGISFYRRDTSIVQVVTVVVGFILILCFAFAFTNWQGFVPVKETIPLLKSFQINRFIWLAPIIWYILFAVCLYYLIQLRNGKMIAITAFSVHFLFSLLHHSEIQARTQLVYKETGGQVSYKEFFSEDLMKEIDQYIGLPKDQYRVASLGIHPAVTQYSGFYTLDSYQNNYLLSYKKNFRKIIAKELEKHEGWKVYFDDWGNRAYIFSAEIPKNKDAFSIDKYSDIKIQNFQFNTEAFREMGGRYLFSAVEIKNNEAVNLKLLNTFEHKDSPWRIHLYEAI